MTDPDPYKHPDLGWGLTLYLATHGHRQQKDAGNEQYILRNYGSALFQDWKASHFNYISFLTL